jgi:hypothetical protein
MIRTVKRLFPITFILCTITFAIGQYTPPTPPVPAELNDILSDSTNWWVQSSWHFQVHGRPLSAVYQDFNLITDSLEKSLTQVCKELKIRDAGLIQWYGFPGPVDSNGSIAKSYPEFGVVLTTYTDSLKNFATKQMIQVLLRRSWGAPQCVFMSEGLATALEGAFGRGKHWRQVQETIRQLSAQNRIPSIADLTRIFGIFIAEVRAGTHQGVIYLGWQQ